MPFAIPGNGAIVLPAATTLAARPAQFASGQESVDAGFVQRALGNMAGYGGLLSTNTALAASAVGQFYSVSGGPTISLPAPSNSLKGATVELIGIDQTAYTVNVTGGSNLIGYALLNAASLSCNGGSPHVFRCNGVNWCVVHGAERYRTDFTASLAANGYQRLPSGLLIQWGYVVAASGGAAVTYPIAFPSKIVSLTFGAQAGASASIWSNAEVSTNNKTGFTLYSSSATAQSSFNALGY